MSGGRVPCVILLNLPIGNKSSLETEQKNNHHSAVYIQLSNFMPSDQQPELHNPSTVKKLVQIRKDFYSAVEQLVSSIYKLQYILLILLFIIKNN